MLEHGMIQDSDRLVGAKTGQYDLAHWDEGFGPVWVYRCSIATLGVVRARTFEEAYDCVCDEILKPIPQEEVPEAYGFDSQEELNAAVAKTESGGEYPDLVEGYQYQSNSTDTGIVSIDLNGEDLRILTPAIADDLGITLTIEHEEE